MTFEDFHAIHNLVNTYAVLADKGDAAGIARHYSRCKLVMPGSTFDVHEQGEKAYEDWYRQLIRIYPDSASPKTRRVMGTIVIEEDGPDCARAQSVVLCLQATPDLPLQPIISGTLYDRYEKIDGIWWIVERREELELVGNMSRHITVEMART